MADEPRSSGAALAHLLAQHDTVPSVEILWEQFCTERRAEINGVLSRFRSESEAWISAFEQTHLPGAATSMESHLRKGERVLQKWLRDLESTKLRNQFQERYHELGSDAWKLGDPKPRLPGVTDDWIQAAVASTARSALLNKAIPDFGESLKEAMMRSKEPLTTAEREALTGYETAKCALERTISTRTAHTWLVENEHNPSGYEGFRKSLSGGRDKIGWRKRMKPERSGPSITPKEEIGALKVDAPKKSRDPLERLREIAGELYVTADESKSTKLRAGAHRALARCGATAEEISAIESLDNCGAAEELASYCARVEAFRED